jgi:hypothetical protein
MSNKQYLQIKNGENLSRNTNIYIKSKTQDYIYKYLSQDGAEKKYLNKNNNIKAYL